MYDIIGDVHGHFLTLISLVRKMGYTREGIHPDGRKLVFVGDLTDRGPQSPEVLDFVLHLVNGNMAECVLGNHCFKAIRAIKKNKPVQNSALAETIRQLNWYYGDDLDDVVDFWSQQPTKLVLDDGKLIVVHGAHAIYGETGEKEKSLNLYSYVTGNKTPEGYPERIDWARNYHGDAIVVHGHQVVNEVYHHNNVWNIDTGCYKGNKLTALRYPEMEIVQCATLEDASR